LKRSGKPFWAAWSIFRFFNSGGQSEKSSAATKDADEENDAEEKKEDEDAADVGRNGSQEAPNDGWRKSTMRIE